MDGALAIEPINTASKRYGVLVLLIVHDAAYMNHQLLGLLIT